MYSDRIVPRFVLSLVSLAFLAGCSRSPSVLAPASPEAGKIADLFWILLLISGVIFFLVEGLLIFAVVRFRSRQQATLPKQVHGNTRLEIAWTVVPSLIVVGIFAIMFPTMSELTQQQAGALKVKVIGHQWWWEIVYPDLGITTASELHVPVGQPIEIEILSADVVHSFWVPELFGKTDTVPGRSNWTRFVASKEGVYPGQCAEFCGVQHANMGFLIIVEPREAFEDWVEEWGDAPDEPDDGPAALGEQAFLTGSCIACHTIDGTRAQGKLGPNLTHFGGRRSIAALTLDNAPENLASWLANPQSIKPGTTMRIPSLSSEVIRNLVAYLESLK
ncbi:MAG: cytochrome c oxidase subunit II [Chloroflexi bacterium]|nr:cytochrome c oxidase subunit II [Chloroflexota bacterium]